MIKSRLQRKMTSWKIMKQYKQSNVLMDAYTKLKAEFMLEVIKLENIVSYHANQRNRQDEEIFNHGSVTLEQIVSQPYS